LFLKKARVASNEDVQERNAESRVGHAYFSGLLSKGWDRELENKREKGNGNEANVRCATRASNPCRQGYHGGDYRPLVKILSTE
jgi:hypothetical protein